MQKLLPIVLCSLFLAFLSDNQSRSTLDDYGGKVYLKKDRLYFVLMAILLAAFVGLRTRGNDTFVYRQGYENTVAELSAIFQIDWRNISGAPGLELVKILCKSIGFTTQDYFMITGSFVTCVYLWFIRKYTSNILLSVYYFITMGCYTFSMAAIKQTMAVAFLMISTDNAIEGRWGKYVFWLLVAELFHPYSFIYLVVPFLFFSPWSQKSYYLLAGTIVVALSMSTLLGAIDTVTDSLGYNYSADSFSGEGVNIFRVLVVWVPVALSFLARTELRCSTDRAMNLIVNLATINAVIMFIGLFGTANYFARLANYFLIFQTIALPWLFRFYKRSNQQILRSVSLICFAIYFYYEMNVAYGAFDQRFAFMSVSDYLFNR